jgi:hypothetical protein
MRSRENALAFLGPSLAAQLEAVAIELKFSEFVLRLSHTTPKLRLKNYSIAAVRARKRLWRQLVRVSGFFTQSSSCHPCDFLASATGCHPKFEEVLIE